MFKVFMILFCFNLFAASPEKEMRKRLANIESPTEALRKCGILNESESWAVTFDKISEKLESDKETCLLDKQDKLEKKAKKFQDAKTIVMDQDCKLLDTDYLKSVCIYLKGRE